MKTFLSVLLSVVFFAGVATAGNRIVENPAYLTRSSAAMAINRIELGSDSTRFFMTFHSYSNYPITVGKSTRLIDRRTKKEYPVLSMQGMQFDKETFMPASGKVDVVMTFPAMPAEIDSVDWIESPGWTIWGVVLNDRHAGTDALSLFRGNWSTGKGPAVWRYGFYKDFAIIDNAFWRYERMEAGRKKVELALVSDDGRRRKLTLCPRKDGSITVSENGSRPERLVRRREGIQACHGHEIDSKRAFFRSETTRLQGYIDGYDPVLGFSTGVAYVRDDLTKKEKTSLIRIRPDGYFESNLELDYPATVFCRLEKGEMFMVYVVPGEPRTVYLCWEDLLKNRLFRSESMPNALAMGTDACVNSALWRVGMPYIDYRLFQERVKEQDPDSFRKEELQILAQGETSLRHILDSLSVCDKASRLLLNGWKMQIGTDFFNYISSRNRGGSAESSKLRVAPDFYDFLQQMPYDDPQSISSSNFSVFVNRYEFCEPFMLVWKKEPFLVEIAAYPLLDILRELNVEPDEEDLSVLAWHKENAGAFISFSPERFRELTAYAAKEKYAKALQIQKERGANHVPVSFEKIWDTKKKTDLYMQHCLDSVRSACLHLPACFLHDVRTLRDLCGLIKSFRKDIPRDYWPDYIDSICNGMTEPAMHAVAEKHFESLYEQQLSKPKDLPDTPEADVLRRIVDPFKGKYVLIDFWATYCSPCRANIERSSQLYADFRESEDLKFIFLTGDRDSPRNLYETFVERHLKDETALLLPQADYNKICSLFGINAVPRYVLLDRTGRLITDNYTGNIRDTLAELLKNEQAAMERK